MGDWFPVHEKPAPGCFKDIEALGIIFVGVLCLLMMLRTVFSGWMKKA